MFLERDPGLDAAPVAAALARYQRRAASAGGPEEVAQAFAAGLRGLSARSPPEALAAAGDADALQGAAGGIGPAVQALAYAANGLIDAASAGRGAGAPPSPPLLKSAAAAAARLLDVYGGVVAAAELAAAAGAAMVWWVRGSPPATDAFQP